MAKKPPPPAYPVHVLTVYSTKPGHKVLRRERCDCSRGKDHSTYESPS